jgi:hypothetical protein
MKGYIQFVGGPYNGAVKYIDEWLPVISLLPPREEPRISWGALEAIEPPDFKVVNYRLETNPTKLQHYVYIP